MQSNRVIVDHSQVCTNALHARLRQWSLTVSRMPIHPQWFSFRGKKKALERVAATKPKCLLDIGSGDGLLKASIPPGARYVGLDYPATGAAYKARPNIYGDACSLPICADVFDEVVLLDVLEHIAKPEHALKEAFRILTPGGRLFINVPYLYPLHDEPYDFQRPTEHGLRNWLQVAGFELEQMEPIGTPAQTIALLFNIAASRFVLRASSHFTPVILIMPVMLLLFLLTNTVAWCMALFGRNERIMPFAYWVVARRPVQHEVGA